ILSGWSSDPWVACLISPDHRAAAALRASALRSFAVAPSILARPPRALPVGLSMLASPSLCQHYPENLQCCKITLAECQHLCTMQVWLTRCQQPNAPPA